MRVYLFSIDAIADTFSCFFDGDYFDAFMKNDAGSLAAVTEGLGTLNFDSLMAAIRTQCTSTGNFKIPLNLVISNTVTYNKNIIWTHFYFSLIFPFWISETIGTRKFTLRYQWF